ncbi:MAG: PhoH family protein [Ruminococcus sp.]|nr:PhoH family protein [Ruminococcus sp.]
MFGGFDVNLSGIEKKFNVSVIERNGEIKILGDKHENVNKAADALSVLLKMSEVTEHSVRYVTEAVGSELVSELKEFAENAVCITVSGKQVKAKTIGQQKYIDAIKTNTIVIGIGPAGTGKTYLAVAMAVKAFKSGEVSRIILTRPAVEAGESLGFLPGDLQDKVDPYLRPLYDALFEMLGGDTFKRHIEKGTIEVAPLAYMRGRTLDNAFIILDEAQNTTNEQLKMFLTRLGTGSKMVVNGDITQIDLPSTKTSGLSSAAKILGGIDDISVVRLSDKDVVRHRLVQDIIVAYEKGHKKNIE